MKTWPPVLIACFLLAGCMSGVPGIGSSGQPTVTGSFALSSPQLGTATVVPATCTAGDRQFFLGGDFSDPSSGITVRLIVDPLDGPVARAFVSATPWATNVVFHRSDCRTFHTSLDSTGWRVNDIYDYSLSLELDCATKDGDTITGKIATPHCY